jgi:predicted lipid-binding transport protein (Tim44 family)
MLKRWHRRVAQRFQRKPTVMQPLVMQPLLMHRAVAGDLQAFLQVARDSFVQMQAAWDRADLSALGLMATDALLDDLREQLAQRGPGPNCTEVLELQARLLALEEMSGALLASVEFSGLIRERLDEHAAPFKELWLLAKVNAAERGWQLARVQSLS